MTDEWVGRTLMRASGALADRLREAPGEAGPGARALADVARSLVREAGRTLALGEADPSLAVLRARGVLRVPADLPSRRLALAFNHLWALVRGHLRELPGASAAMDRHLRESLRAAARVILAIDGARRAGLEADALDRRSGIVLVLVFDGGRG